MNSSKSTPVVSTSVAPLSPEFHARAAAAEGLAPPISNTGGKLSEGSESTEAANALQRIQQRCKIAGAATIIDTLSLVFPMRALLPECEAVEVSIDRGPTHPKEALALSPDEQYRLASEWWREGGQWSVTGAEPPRDRLISLWVNHLWRVVVTTGGAERPIDPEFQAAADMSLSSLGLTLSPRPGGKNGFRYSAALYPAPWDYARDGQPSALGHVAWGGIQNRGGVELAQLHLTGAGCEWLGMADAWAELRSMAYSWGAHITRVDVAYDDWQGVHGRPADEWDHRYQAGEFTLRRDPARKLIQGADGAGDSLYIGTRRNGKMLRIYEKGCQLGDSSSPWVRLELELRNVDRDIPLDVLTDPDGLFAGGYPPLLSVLDSPDVEPVHVPFVVRNRAAVTISALSRHAQNAYGQLIDTLQSVGLSADEVVERLRRPGVPRRLAQSPAFVQALGDYVPSPS